MLVGWLVQNGIFDGFSDSFAAPLLCIDKSVTC